MGYWVPTALHFSQILAPLISRTVVLEVHLSLGACATVLGSQNRARTPHSSENNSRFVIFLLLMGCCAGHGDLVKTAFLPQLPIFLMCFLLLLFLWGFFVCLLALPCIVEELFCFSSGLLQKELF